MRRSRLAVLLASVATVSLAGSALAAGPNTLSFKDAPGDNVSPSAASDITGVTYTTAGSGKGKAYTAKSLVVTLALGAAPTSDGTTVYDVHFSVPGCGAYSMQYMPGAELIQVSGYAECGSEPDETGSTGTLFDPSVEVKGNSIVYTVPLKTLPGKVAAGTTLTDLLAYTDFVEPATGLFGPAGLFGADAAVYDKASTTSSYKVG